MADTGPGLPGASLSFTTDYARLTFRCTECRDGDASFTDVAVELLNRLSDHHRLVHSQEFNDHDTSG